MATLKDSRLDLRLDLGQKTLFEQAAAAQGKRLSEFVIEASTLAAQVALADQTRFELPGVQMERFLARLEEPPQPIPKLRALFDRKSVLPG